MTEQEEALQVEAYGVKSHAWSALALCITWFDMRARCHSSEVGGRR